MADTKTKVRTIMELFGTFPDEETCEGYLIIDPTHG